MTVHERIHADLTDPMRTDQEMKAAFARGDLWRLRCPHDECRWLSAHSFSIRDQFANIGHCSAELFSHLRQSHKAIYVRVGPA